MESSIVLWTVLDRKLLGSATRSRTQKLRAAPRLLALAISYGRVTRSSTRPLLMARLAGLLATGKLSQQQRREVAFVAGIRLSATGS